MMQNVLPLLFAHASLDVVDQATLRAVFDKARRGDDDAVATLCRVMRPRLYRTALSVLKDPAAADDIAHDAIIRALKKRALFLGTGSVSGWMCRIAQNLAKNARRDRKRRHALLDEHHSSAVSSTVSAQRRSPHEQVEHAELQQHLHTALDALPPRQRDVARLRLVAELDFSEIAAVLKITDANARVAFSAAKRSLTQTLTATLGVAGDTP